MNLWALAARAAKRQRIRRHRVAQLTRELPEETLAQTPSRPDAIAETIDRPVPPSERRDGPTDVSRIDDLSILPPGGTVLFTFRNVIRPGGAEYDEEMLFLMGKVAVVYQDAAAGRTMSLRAERAVIFLAPDALPDLTGNN